MYKDPKNVFGTPLSPCSTSPMTGFFRDGYCNTGPFDHGRHLVCTRVTKDFLEYSKEQGNDLSTPRPEAHFQGLKPGDSWCICAARWKQAFEDDRAAPIILSATHEKALDFVPLPILQKYSIDDAMKQTIN